MMMARPQRVWLESRCLPGGGQLLILTTEVN
jgi:hypothetical protein